MKSIGKAFKVSIVLMIICGYIYPVVLTGIGTIFFHNKANGSMITLNGKEIGSKFIGQNFTGPGFFHGRISAVNYNTYTKEDLKTNIKGGKNYGGVGSGSQNLGPSNKKLEERVKTDIEQFLKNHPGVKKEDITAELLTSSSSGLDPHISPKGAKIQISAIAKATGLSERELNALVDKHTEGRQLGVLGEPRVNVLKINIELSEKLK